MCIDDEGGNGKQWRGNEVLYSLNSGEKRGFLERTPENFPEFVKDSDLGNQEIQPRQNEEQIESTSEYFGSAWCGGAPYNPSPQGSRIGLRVSVGSRPASST